VWNQLFARKSLERLHAEMQDDNRLRRVLGPVGLTALGIGAIIGSGIFVTTGEAAATKAGPAVMLAFVVAGLGCALAAFCYAEFAAMAPVAGSAYTYAYATLGELLAWIIGWDLVLEYAMSCAVIASDWTKYFNEFLEVISSFFGMNWRLPDWISTDAWTLMSKDPNAWVNMPGEGWEKWSLVFNPAHWPLHGFNLLAVAIMAACTIVLVIGVRESATTNAVLVAVKVGAVLFVIGVGIRYISASNWTSVPMEDRKITDMGELLRRRPDIAKLIPVEKRDDLTGEKLIAEFHDAAALLTPDEKVEFGKLGSEYEKWGAMSVLGMNHFIESYDDKWRSPFMPYGLSGIMAAAAAVFFAYIGFDAISTHSEEAIRPQRDVPIGILASLAVCTVLYFCVAAVITGMEPYPTIDKDAAVAVAFKRLAIKQDSWALRISAALIATGALAGMTSVILITFLSQARIFLAMARDGLLPQRVFGTVHPRFRTPHLATMLTGGILCVITALTPMEVLFNMVNIGTLLAFIIVCASVLLLRIRRPEAPRPFRCPFIFVLAPLGIFVNASMMLFLPIDTWYRLFIWLGAGLVIYFVYGRFNSTLAKDMKLGSHASHVV
jgi:basic amino acid/polyamine antiporter, APA family